MGGYGQGGYGQGPYGGGGSSVTQSQIPLFSLPRAYYLSLLTSEYRNSPNLNAWLTALIAIEDNLLTCLGSVQAAFDLDTAVGDQLDVLGAIVGVSRTLPFQPSDGVSPVLSDAAYQTLILARIAWNQWDGAADSLAAIWGNLFPGGAIRIKDNQNMTADVLLTGSFNSITVDMINNGLIVPRPEGVLYNFVFGTLPAFGFDLNNAYVAGFDLGHWS